MDAEQREVPGRHPGRANTLTARLHTFTTIENDSGALRLGMRPGRLYRVTGWIFVPAATGLNATDVDGLKIVAFTSGGTTGTRRYASNMPTATDAWVELRVDIAVPTDATSAYVRLYNGFSVGTGKHVYFDDLSVREHLEYVSAIHGAPATADEIDALLEQLGLTARADDLPARFSRGLRQRAGLAVGLVRPFALLLVDEPFVGLDTPGQETLVEVLADVAEQGAAVLVSTHQMDLTPKASRCIGLRDGELAYDGKATPEKIRELVG